LQVMEYETRAHDGKVRVRKGKRIDITLLPAYIFQALILLRFTRLLQHRRGHIDAGSVLCHASKSARQQAGTAGHVEHGVIRAGASPLHNTIQCFLIADRSSGGKWRSLARELIENA